MPLSATLSQLPARLSAASVLLHSGADKLGADEDTSAALHGLASGTYPVLGRLPATTFVRRLGQAEIALGVALAVPFVPARLVGAGLTAFAAGLLGLYLRTPGMRRDGSLRPTQDGLAIAKDVWLLGIGSSLLLSPRSRPSRRAAAGGPTRRAGPPKLSARLR